VTLFHSFVIVIFALWSCFTLCILSELYIYATSDSFMDRMLLDLGVGASVFVKDDDLARKWVMASVTRENCTRPGKDVEMLNTMEEFRCEGESHLRLPQRTRCTS
jgi:hypothetical protein